MHWLGPYEVVNVNSNRSLQLKDFEGNLLPTRINEHLYKPLFDAGGGIFKRGVEECSTHIFTFRTIFLKNYCLDRYYIIYPHTVSRFI